MNFWDVHGLIFVVCLFFFPRVTLIFATAWGGLLWWIGWIFAPRLLVAILATTYYWETNMILVILNWFWAIGGEGAEKRVMTHKSVRTVVIRK